MRELVIEKNDAGQRLNKYLGKYFKEAPSSFLYRMLRKKNIILNEKRAKGDEILGIGDKVTLFLSEETIEKFRGQKNLPATENTASKSGENLSGRLSVDDLKILYRDENILAVHKPVGILSQKASASDHSINETILDYCTREKIYEEGKSTFKPSVCNRLDRNTSGIILAGISLAGTQYLTELIRKKELEKIYFTIVKGTVGDQTLTAYLKKDDKKNKSAVIFDADYQKLSEKERADYRKIETEVFTVSAGSGYSLLKIRLITGKTHQIRAHLKALGSPVLGDPKYGDPKSNLKLKRKYGLDHQLLHAGEVRFPKSGLVIRDRFPEEFLEIGRGEKIWQHGIPEV